ncbi:hypothetical protein [Ktedonobacter racemifer]|uniref:hypothetical protein n=1 Tax=Ktedonobacter racemifer TaxID=363277 RepID=UPI00058FA0A6|nr:hypothetical protein [Ktedonobacter racemifer]
MLVHADTEESGETFFCPDAMALSPLSSFCSSVAASLKKEKKGLGEILNLAKTWKELFLQSVRMLILFLRRENGSSPSVLILFQKLFRTAHLA